MKLLDVQHGLRGLNIKVPRGTLGRWSVEGLLPAPVGVGRWADWSDIVVYEAAAAYHLLHQGWERDEIRRTRKFARHLFLEIEEPDAVTEYGEVRGESSKYYEDYFNWVILVSKARLNIKKIRERRRIRLVYQERDGGVELRVGERGPVLISGGVFPREIDTVEILRAWDKGFQESELEGTETLAVKKGKLLLPEEF
jgi:hypothetical protein